MKLPYDPAILGVYLKKPKILIQNIYAPLCYLQYNLQKPSYGSNPSAHPQSSGFKKKKLQYTYIIQYYSPPKKKEILPFATAWMDLEDIMISEIRQSEKDKYHMISLICGI